MSNPVVANQFILLGRIIQNLGSPAAFVPTVYKEEIENLFQQLVTCELPVSRVSAKCLEGIPILPDAFGKVSSLAA